MNNDLPTPRGSGLATTSLILGILAVVLGVVGVGGLLGILAIIFGAISFKANKGKSLAGIITGAIGLLVSIAVTILFFASTTSDLQANQQDAARKNDLSVIQSRTYNFMSQNGGDLPGVDAITSPLSELSVATEVVESSTGAEPTTTRVVYGKEVNCDNVTGSRHFSLTVKLESGDPYCIGS